MRMRLSIFSFKKIAKRSVAILLLIVCVSAIFYRFFKLVQYPRDNFYIWDGFVEKDTVDVLCVGSSHVSAGINPVYMYDKYGIAAFDLTGGAQAVWFSYYYIKEALKEQHPKAVILDVFTLPMEESFFESRIKYNLINLPLSYNKWEALETSGAENKAELFFAFPAVHTRYNELMMNSYNPDQVGDLFLGYIYHPIIVPYPEAAAKDMSGVKECEPIPEKAEEYLRKSIELCQSEGIDIILVNAPWPDIEEEHQQKYNYIQKIADEYAVPFLNGCLYDEIGMDYTVDSMGDSGHLNHTGATKWTKWLSVWLKENYELPDRRGDDRWAEWERQSDKLKAAVLRNELSGQTEIDAILNMIENDENIYYAISLNGDFSREGSGEILGVLDDKGFDVSKKGVYVRNGTKELFSSNGEAEYNYWHYFNSSVLNVYEEDGKQLIFWNRTPYTVVSNGINIFMYDERLDEVIGCLGYDADNNYEVIRWK